MDLHVELLINQYHENLENYQKIQEIVVSLLKEYLKDNKTVINKLEYRIKTEESLLGKLEIKGQKYRSIFDVTDIFGARIITFYSDEVDKYGALIEKHFVVDWARSVDKRKIYNIDQFGYMSLHFICYLPPTLKEVIENPVLGKIPFELQLRTTLQHTWASIYHDTGYKSDVEVPKEYLRSLNRLAGLLEMADDEFNHIKSSIVDYRRKVKTVVASGDFSSCELNGDTYKEYLKIEPFAKLNKRIAEINNMEIEEVPLIQFLSVFKFLGINTLEELRKMIEDNSENAYQIAVHLFGSTDLDIMSSFTAPQLLSIVYCIKLGFGYGGVREILTLLYGKRSSNERNAEKAMEIAKRIGLTN